MPFKKSGQRSGGKGVGVLGKGNSLGGYSTGPKPHGGFGGGNAPLGKKPSGGYGSAGAPGNRKTSHK